MQSEKKRGWERRVEKAFTDGMGRSRARLGRKTLYANTLHTEEQHKKELRESLLTKEGKLVDQSTGLGSRQQRVDQLRARRNEYEKVKTRELDSIMDDLSKAEDVENLHGLYAEFRAALGMPMESSSGGYGWVSDAWFSICRLRFAFFIIVAFAILLALCTGLLMEIFFAGFSIDPAQMDWWLKLKWHLIFWLLPFWMMLLALIGDEMCDLILDSLNRPALNEFQAVLLAVLTKQKHEHHFCPDPWQVYRVDVITFLLLELLPVSVAFGSLYLLSDYRMIPSMLVMGYVQGSLLSAVLTTLLFGICDILTDHKEGIKLWISQTISRKNMNPYTLHRHFLKHSKRLDAIDEIAEREDKIGEREEDAECAQIRFALSSVRNGGGCCSRMRNKVRACFGQWEWVVTLFTIAVWTVLVFVLQTFKQNQTYRGKPLMIGGMVVVVVTICSWHMRRKCPDLTGTPYILILTFFVVVSASLNCGAASKVTSGISLPDMMTLVDAGVAPGGGNRSMFGTWQPELPGLPETQCKSLGEKGCGSLHPPRAQPYPLCDMSWGSPDAPLRALDLANLAWIVYDSSSVPSDLLKSNITRLLNRSFQAERRAQVLNISKYEDLPRLGHFYFPPTGNGTRGTHVVAVKGTSTIMDALVDTNLFATVQVLQAFSQWMPVLTVLPRLVIQWMLQHIHLHTAQQFEQRIRNNLIDTIKTFVEEHPDDYFVLTGHSLGGGFAQIAAARLTLPAVVWSAPGTVYSAKRFGIEVQALKQNVVSVMPDHDAVPRVDLQGGMLQLIECRLKDGTEGNAMKCHSLLKTACEVWRVCGDSRNFSGSCKDFVNPRDVGRLYHDDDSTS